MSITTQRGDGGETDLMYGRRVAKTHPRVAACGEVDELNAALGLARAFSTRDRVTAALASRQAELVPMMGELATDEADRARYRTDGYAEVTAETVEQLTAETTALELELNTHFRDWATPGADTTPCGAALDLARTVCRRAERAALAAGVSNPEIRCHLNRLSDFLWLLARFEAKAMVADGK